MGYTFSDIAYKNNLQNNLMLFRPLHEIIRAKDFFRDIICVKL